MAKISAPRTKFKINKYKFGVQVPTDYTQDLELDKNNGNTFL